MLAISGFIIEDNRLFESYLFWFIYSKNIDSFVWSQLGIVILLILGFCLYIRFKMLFRKTGSAEIFFFEIFLFTFLFEAFRQVILLLYTYNLPVEFSIFFMRIIYFGRFSGLLAFLVSSLFALDIKYQKYEILIGIISLTSLGFAISIPIESQAILYSGLFKLGDEQGIFIICLTLKAFIVLNFLIASLKRRYLMIALASFFIILGREFLIFSSSIPLLILGTCIFMAGIFIFHSRIKMLYYWV